MSGPTGRLSGEEAGAAADAAPLDRAVYDDLLALIGRAQALALLDRLALRLGESFGGEGTRAPDRLRLGRDAHAMISAAGMLGFQALSEACRALEAASVSGEGVAAALARVQRLHSAALDTIEALKRSA